MEPLLEDLDASKPNPANIRARRIERPPLDESEIGWHEEPVESGALGYHATINGYDVVLIPGVRGRWRWSVMGVLDVQAQIAQPKKPLSRALGLVVGKNSQVLRRPLVRVAGDDADNLRAAKNAALVSAFRRSPGGPTG